jgi:pimeloyl-ACP methyl ester carboxylesterase
MRIKVGDSKLFFDIEGAKLRPDGSRMREVPTLVLLHGGPGFDHSNCKPDLSPLAEVAQLVYLDHRSQGRSDRTSRDRWTLDHWANDVRSFCDALEIERPIVMGHSFGGFVAMAYAIRHPSHPAKLILSSTTARQRLDRTLAVFERLGGLRAREVADRFWRHPSDEARDEYLRVCLPLYNRRKLPSDPDMMSRTVSNVELMGHFINGEMRTFNLLPDLGRIQCPTLILGGEDDPILPIEDSEDIARAIPSHLARFERFANAGHGVYRDAPDRALQILRDFITG